MFIMTNILVLNDNVNVSIINVYNVYTELRINQLFDLFSGLITFIKRTVPPFKIVEKRFLEKRWSFLSKNFLVKKIVKNYW